MVIIALQVLLLKQKDKLFCLIGPPLNMQSVQQELSKIGVDRCVGGLHNRARFVLKKNLKKQPE